MELKGKVIKIFENVKREGNLKYEMQNPTTLEKFLFLLLRVFKSKGTVFGFTVYSEVLYVYIKFL